jgi:hypothetical protein
MFIDALFRKKDGYAPNQSFVGANAKECHFELLWILSWESRAFKELRDQVSEILPKCYNFTKTLKSSESSIAMHLKRNAVFFNVFYRAFMLGIQKEIRQEAQVSAHGLYRNYTIPYNGKQIHMDERLGLAVINNMDLPSDTKVRVQHKFTNGYITITGSADEVNAMAYMEFNYSLLRATPTR